MRNPYITGGWVSGHEHYGRETLIAHILESENDAVWLVGNRRMGKTSLLRQLEFLSASAQAYVPLFWDMQGSTTTEDLAAELLYAVEDEGERFAPLMVDFDRLRQLDAVGIIRLLRRQARNAGKRLLLLCDEAEALLNLVETAPQTLASLRKVLLSANGLRVVLASTKVLSRINALSDTWETSPFLFGFGLRNLAPLDDASTAALIRHSLDPVPVRVSDEQVKQISEATGNHPFLTQVLCYRLFVDTTGELRPLTPEDLYLDSSLIDYFQNDFRWLSPGERQVLLSVAAGNSDVAAICEDTELPPQVVEDFVYSQERLGQIRKASAGLQPANEFLRRWIEQNYETLLEASQASEVPDDTTRQLVHRGQQEEARYLTEQLHIQRANLNELNLQRAQYGIRVPLDLVNDINRVKLEIERLEQRLAFISPQIVAAAEQQAADAVA